MLADFGLSKILGENSIAFTACGTPYYIAPEVLTAQGYGMQVDMWSIGVITYFLLAGFPPFMAESLQDMVELILKGNYTFEDKYWNQVSLEARNFVVLLLQVQPERRMTATQALIHPWLKNGLENDKPLNREWK